MFSMVQLSLTTYLVTFLHDDLSYGLVAAGLALSGLFGTYRAGFLGLMVMASISGTVLYFSERPR
jgi:hypothetical protein